MPALDGWRAREHDEAAALQLGAMEKDVARVKPWGAGRLVGGVLLVEEHEGRRRGEGHEQRAARAHHHARPAARGSEPGRAALPGARPAIEAARVESAGPA